MSAHSANCRRVHQIQIFIRCILIFVFKHIFETFSSKTSLSLLSVDSWLILFVSRSMGALKRDSMRKLNVIIHPSIIYLLSISQHFFSMLSPINSDRSCKIDKERTSIWWAELWAHYLLFKCLLWACESILAVAFIGLINVCVCKFMRFQFSCQKFRALNYDTRLYNVRQSAHLYNASHEFREVRFFFPSRHGIHTEILTKISNYREIQADKGNQAENGLHKRWTQNTDKARDSRCKFYFFHIFSMLIEHIYLMHILAQCTMHIYVDATRIFSLSQRQRAVRRLNKRMIESHRKRL